MLSAFIRKHRVRTDTNIPEQGTHLISAMPAACLTRPKYVVKSYRESGNGRSPGNEADIFYGDVFAPKPDCSLTKRSSACQLAQGLVMKLTLASSLQRESRTDYYFFLILQFHTYSGGESAIEVISIEVPNSRLHQSIQAPWQYEVQSCRQLLIKVPTSHLQSATVLQLTLQISFRTLRNLNHCSPFLFAMAGVQYYTVFGQKVGAHIVCLSCYLRKHSFHKILTARTIH